MAEFREEEHPRDAAGKFTEGAGAGSVSRVATPDSIQNHRSRAKSFSSKAEYGPAREAAYHLGFRADSAEDYALADHMEKASDHETMLRVYGSKGSWDSGYAAASLEWKAAGALGGSGSMGAVAKEAAGSVEQLSDAEVAAFKARQEFMQESVRARLGDEFTLYRGLSGRQAAALRKAGVQPGDEIELGVHELASFAEHQTSAQNFASGKNGIVVEARVSYKDVWMSRDVGMKPTTRFLDDVGEIVLLNKAPTIKVRVL